MTILEAFEIANKNAGIKKATLANLQALEWESFMESFKSEDFPFNVVLPFTSNGNTINERRKAIVPLKGWILTQVREDAVDYRSLSMEKKYLEPMRKLAGKFLKELYKTDIINTEEVAKGISDTIAPEYMFTNRLLFGVSYTVNLPILESVC